MRRLDAATPFRACLLGVALLLLTGCGCDNGPTEEITIAGEVFTLEVASTTEAIKKGLGERTSIPENGGMIFVFPDAQPRRFWMVRVSRQYEFFKSFLPFSDMYLPRYVVVLKFVIQYI